MDPQSLPILGPVKLGNNDVKARVLAFDLHLWPTTLLRSRSSPMPKIKVINYVKLFKQESSETHIHTHSKKEILKHPVKRWMPFYYDRVFLSLKKYDSEMPGWTGKGTSPYLTDSAGSLTKQLHSTIFVSLWQFFLLLGGRQNFSRDPKGITICFCIGQQGARSFLWLKRGGRKNWLPAITDRASPSWKKLQLPSQLDGFACVPVILLGGRFFSRNPKGWQSFLRQSTRGRIFFLWLKKGRQKELITCDQTEPLPPSW